jgi:hypothetical protein
MKIYSVYTHIRFDAYPKKANLGREFTKTIEIPFLPYHFEGKRFYLTFQDECGNEFTTSFDVKYTTWRNDKSKKGYWSMCISAGVHEDRFKRACEIIENDILHKNSKKR